ncbi:hypothetical protein [Streptomyces ureilyticus]|uniref:Uncharacterized protein n=1 Tax=Streptomyces ureilyticus TaxID=1775131 RepID=A0ABX0DY25_9ACTN|nr:hypothetical protein [Streptomyces ureilyticus]NGO45794.1 hypothetical protein [Streptomyces ureilyticus]
MSVNDDCGVPDPTGALLCARVPAHDGDHRADGRNWARSECWTMPPELATPCVLDREHDGRHVATAWRGTGEGQPVAVRVEWDERGVTWLPDAPLPRPAWTPNPAAAWGDEGESIVSCLGYPDCTHCTKESPGPVGIPVLPGKLPDEQLLAEMAAHANW